ncbi:MAG: hypothetical protein H0X17_12325, partial [Deltaproteobacteria bacterium]|nr:hypothetical protein [Deltaproteobacteria bacterium]
MIYALRVSDVSTTTGTLTVYQWIDEQGLSAPVLAATDEQALRVILAKADGHEVCCDEALAEAAGPLGVRVTPPPAWTLVPRADLATVLNLGVD